MTIETKVGGDGILTTKVPDRFKGRRVRISIREVQEQIPSQWAQISKILEDLGALDMPCRGHDEILREIRTFRES